MALSNVGIPDFECLGVHDEGAVKEVAKVHYLSESIAEELTSESDTTEEYSSSDDMEDSNELSNDSLELDNGPSENASSVVKSLCTFAGGDMNIEYAQYNTGIPTEIDLDNQINIFQENSNIHKGYETPVFTNLPNLPTDGLFGASINNEPSAPEASSLALQSEAFLPANLPNVIEMHSKTANESANENGSSVERSIVYNKDYMPKLDAVTEHFEAVFTIGAKERGNSIGYDRSRSNIKMLRKKRTRRQSKH